MNEFEKTHTHYVKEYFKVIENTDIVSKPKKEPRLKYDEKPVQAELVELSSHGLEALGSFSPIVSVKPLRGRRH